MTSIKNLPKHKQPREKLMEQGPENLKDKELLAIILRTGVEGKNVIEVSDDILKKYSMKKLLKLTFADLVKIKGIDVGKACSLLASFELIKRGLDVQDNNLPIINSVRDAVGYLQNIARSKKEHFVVLYLNARNQLVRKENISVGTLTESLVHPREVFYPAIKYLASSIILAHNHPSGDITPSENDIVLTRRFEEVSDLMGIDVIDHIIITENNFLSIKEYEKRN